MKRGNDTPMADTSKSDTGKGNIPTNKRGQPLYGPGSPLKGKKGKSGAKPGVPQKHGLNINKRLRHGLRSGTLPARLRYVEHACNALRRNLESATLELKGQIDISDAAAINSAMKWEMHGMLSRHWLRTQIDDLSPADRLRFSEAIAKASDSRDRAIRLLSLDKAPDAPWAAIDVPPATEEADQ